VEPWLDAACAEVVSGQIRTSFVGPGAACNEFANALAAVAGSPHCILTTSGTIALSVAAKALGLMAGDEVLVPAYGVISTINAFGSVGLAPRLVDVDVHTACMDPAALERSITSATKAVCYVNFSGYTGKELESIAALCTERGLPLIEDAACAIGHAYRGRNAGSIGTIGTYSFSVPKTVTTGQGGALFTESPQLADEILKFIDQGDLNWRKTNLNHEIGTNLRFNDVLASLGMAQMRSLPERLARKLAAHRALGEVLGDRLCRPSDTAAPLYNIVFTGEPDAVVSDLRARGILAQRHGRALYEHPAYASLAGSFPAAERWSQRAVYLPFGLGLSEDDARYVGSVVNEVAGSRLQAAP
jgi:perosamine synthetase